MAKRPAETLDDLLDALAPGESLEDLAKRLGVTSRQLRYLRAGKGKRPFRTTVDKIAAGLGVEPARVRSAIQASAAAARKPQ